MKRLNKIALSVVALVAAVISGCGADEKNVPVIRYINHQSDGNIAISYNVNKDEIQNIVYLEGRRPCKIDIYYMSSYGYNDGLIRLKAAINDCPPKDRLNDQSYKLKVKTKSGRHFCYEGSTSNYSKITISDGSIVGKTYFRPVKCNK